MQLRPMQTGSAATTSSGPVQAQLAGEARPLQAAPDSTDPPSPWHERALLKASERLDLLDDCRAATAVVEALLAERLPAARDFEAMGDTA